MVRPFERTGANTIDVLLFWRRRLCIGLLGRTRQGNELIGWASVRYGRWTRPC